MNLDASVGASPAQIPDELVREYAEFRDGKIFYVKSGKEARSRSVTIGRFRVQYTTLRNYFITGRWLREYRHTKRRDKKDLKYVSVYLTKEAYNEITAYAQARNITISTLFRAATIQYVRKNPCPSSPLTSQTGSQNFSSSETQAPAKPEPSLP